jgi:flavin reductase (DIM6/NTAB) family NADH-FMN oxidoreductase RutF
MPILEGAIAHLECAVVERIAVGDHYLYVGRVEACGEDDPAASPLLYHRRRYLRIERSTTATVVGKPDSQAG